MSQNQKKPKASEKLAALEQSLMNTARRVGELEMIVFNISREKEILKDALQLINEKQEAIISLITEGQSLTTENINTKIVSLKEENLKEKIESLVKNGDVVTTEEVSEQSLLVTRELDGKGEVINPRLQFLVGRLIPEMKEKFIGKKVGDLIKTEEGKLDLEIMEIYNVVDQEISEEESSSEETKSVSEESSFEEKSD